MLSFLANLFSIRKADGSISPTTIGGFVGAVVVALATVPGGPAFIASIPALAGPYAPLVLAVVAVLSGAAINHETSPKA